MLVAQVTTGEVKDTLSIAVALMVPAQAWWNARKRRLAKKASDEDARRLAEEVSEKAIRTAIDVGAKHTKAIHTIRRAQIVLEKDVHELLIAKTVTNHRLDQIGQKLDIEWTNGSVMEKAKPRARKS